MLPADGRRAIGCVASGTACATSSRTLAHTVNATSRAPALAAKIAMYAPMPAPMPPRAIDPIMLPAAAAKLLNSMKSAIMLVRSSSRIASSASRKNPSSYAPNAAPVRACRARR